MAFWTVKADAESVKDYEGSTKYITQSGIYEVVIKNVIVDKSEKGSESINLWIECNEQEQPIFQAMRLTNNDGSPNEMGQNMFNKFCVVAGADENTEIANPVSVMVPIGKGGEEKECMVLEQFNDTPMFLRIQMEYSLYNDKIQERKLLRNVFRYEDKATAAEIVNNAENKGSQFEKESEYADAITYKDGLTEEDVQQYLKDRKAGKNIEKDKKPSGGFGGKKRAFGGNKSF